MTTKSQTDKTHKNFFGNLFYNINILAVIFPLTMIIPNVILDITESMSVWAKIANVLVPLSIYLLLISNSHKTGRTILFLLIMIVMNSMQLVILYLYGESIIAIDMLLNCLTTNPAEASELLNNLWFPIILCIVIYVPQILWAIFACIKKLKSGAELRAKLKKSGLIGLGAGIVFTVIAQLVGPSFAINRNIYPINVISNIGSALGRTWKSVNYHETSADYRFNAVDTHDSIENDLYVLVIGETSRVGNWELFGYERETNPRLIRRTDIVRFPLAISQSNTTHKCVPMMLTNVTTETFDSIMYCKSITTAFKEAGYYTAFFSNQAKNGSYTQFFSEEADTVNYLEEADHFDMNLLPLLDNLIHDNSGRKQFVILHSYGSHFNYKERYPDQYSYFEPDNASNANKNNRAQLINAYDNSIRYTDHFLDSIISMVEATGRRSAVIFSSDHGEDIFDDSRGRFLHASPTPTYYQLHVPMFVWMSEKYENYYPDVATNLRNNSEKYVAPSQAMFHTLLGISGIMTDFNDPRNSLTSDRFSSPKPLYLSDYNDGVPLEESGLKSQDIVHFVKLGVLNSVDK